MACWPPYGFVRATPERLYSIALEGLSARYCDLYGTKGSQWLCKNGSRCQCEDDTAGAIVGILARYIELGDVTRLGTNA